MNFLNDFENLLTRYAAEKGCQGVITGHTHTPIVKQVNGIVYVNCGDFQERATVLVEHADGNLELVDLQAAKVAGAVAA